MVNNVGELEKDFNHVFSAEVKKKLEVGFLLLAKMPDHRNGLKHVNKILKILKTIYRDQVLTISSDELEALIVAAVWHDIWKVNNVRGLWGLLLTVFTEGESSARLFGVEKNSTLQEAGEIIRHHDFVHFWRQGRLEKIFCDLDQSDSKKPSVNSKFWEKLIYVGQKLMPKKYYYSEIKKIVYER